MVLLCTIFFIYSWILSIFFIIFFCILYKANICFPCLTSNNSIRLEEGGIVDVMIGVVTIGVVGMAGDIVSASASARGRIGVVNLLRRIMTSWLSGELIIIGKDQAGWKEVKEDCVDCGVVDDGVVDC